MKIYRLIEVKLDDVQIGDKLDIYLTNIQKFKATVHRIHEAANGVKFVTCMFDDCIAEHSMNVTSTNLGGFEVSDACKWLKENIFPLFPEELKDKITSLTLPSYGMIFGHDDWYKRTLESDNDEQFVLMKKRLNRTADIYDEEGFYWLSNAALSIFDSKSFGGVTSEGKPSVFPAQYYFGIRPVFTILLDNNKDWE